MELSYYLDLLGYGRERIEPFRRALEAAVRPGDRVAEVGAGLGTFAVLAARAGAGEVVGLERGAVVEVAREVARASGVDDRVRFVRGDLHGWSLEPRADLVIFENFGSLLLGAETDEDLRAIRERILVPGGRFVPARARIHLAAAAPDRRPDPFDEGSELEGVDLTPVVERAARLPRNPRVEADDLLGPAVEVCRVDLPEAPPRRVVADLTIRRAGTLDSIVGWFDLELAPGVEVSNRPGEPTAWGRLAFPVGPVEVAEGRTLHVELSWSSYGRSSVWRWDATLEGEGSVLEAWRRSSFGARVESTAGLARHDPDHRPALSAEGRHVARVIQAVEEGASFDEIAADLCETWPDRFSGRREALGWVASLVGQVLEA